MKEQFLSQIASAQMADIVTSYGGDADTRINPRVIVSIASKAYDVGVTIMVHPPFNQIE